MRIQQKKILILPFRLIFEWILFIYSEKHVMKISETSILSDQTPLLLCDSELCLATSDGNLSTVVLTSHLNRATVETKGQIKTFIDMRRFDDAWHLCKSINRSDIWYELGKAAIAELDINFGITFFFLRN